MTSQPAGAGTGGKPQGPLPPLLLAPTVVTGVVDAVSILRLGRVFVANMTGNVGGRPAGRGDGGHRARCPAAGAMARGVTGRVEPPGVEGGAADGARQGRDQ